MNRFTYEPVTPPDEHGYVQLTVNETATTLATWLLVVWDDMSYFDDSVSASATSSVVTFGISGFATNGTDQATFEITFQLSGSEGNGVLA